MSLLDLGSRGAGAKMHRAWLRPTPPLIVRKGPTVPLLPLGGFGRAFLARAEVEEPQVAALMCLWKLHDQALGPPHPVEAALGFIHQLTGVPSAFTPDYAPEEMFEIANRLYRASL